MHGLKNTASRCSGACSFGMLFLFRPENSGQHHITSLRSAKRCLLAGQLQLQGRVLKGPEIGVHHFLGHFLQKLGENCRAQTAQVWKQRQRLEQRASLQSCQNYGAKTVLLYWGSFFFFPDRGFSTWEVSFSFSFGGWILQVQYSTLGLLSLSTQEVPDPSVEVEGRPPGFFKSFLFWGGILRGTVQYLGAVVLVRPGGP